MIWARWYRRSGRWTPAVLFRDFEFGAASGVGERGEGGPLPLVASLAQEFQVAEFESGEQPVAGLVPAAEAEQRAGVFGSEAEVRQKITQIVLSNYC